MWSALPPAIGAGLLLALAFPDAEISASESRFAVASMLASHKAAFVASEAGGFQTGSVASDLPHPLNELRAWRSEIVADANGAVLLTWHPGFATGGAERRFDSAFAELNPPDARFGLSARHFVGEFALGDQSTAFVGSVPVPLPTQNIPAGAPVVAQRLP